jgi:hypothetical protein
MMIQMCPTEVRVSQCVHTPGDALVWAIYPYMADGLWVWVSHSHIHLCRQSIM